MALFHYFNPNGLYAKKKAVDARIDTLVDEGKAMPGAMIAYGALNYYYADHLSDLAAMIGKKRIKHGDIHSVIRGLQWDIEKAEKFIAEKELNAALAVALTTEGAN
jgi:hypothetical protein